MKKLLLSLALIISFTGMAQKRTCGTDQKVDEVLAKDPSFAIHHKEVMDYIRNPNNQQNIFKQARTTNTVVTIPVVFHVLYKNASQNITDAQIQSQLAVLNEDYRKLNADFSTVVPNVFQSVAADMEIAFCMATQTPTGAATTGITRKSVASSFDFDDNYYTTSGEPAWDPTRYLNVWIGNYR